MVFSLIPERRIIFGVYQRFESKFYLNFNFTGLSQWYPFCSVLMIEAIQVAMSTMFSDLEEDIMLENKIIYISRNVFARMMSTAEDSSLVMNISDTLLRGVVFNTVGILEFGQYKVPLPPPNVGKLRLHLAFDEFLEIHL